MEFKTNIGAQGQTDVVALRNFQAEFPSLNASELLEGAMIVLNQPGAVGIGLTTDFIQVQAASSPVFRVAVWVKGP